MGLLRRKFNPYEPIDLPDFGGFLLPDPRGLKAAMKGDDGWVVDTDAAIQVADNARGHITAEAKDIADRLLALGSGQMPDELRQRTAAEVQWGLTFARSDPHRLNEHPPLAHTLFTQRIVGRTTWAEGEVGQFLAGACRIGFVYGRGGPGSVDLPPLHYHAAWNGTRGATFTLTGAPGAPPQISWQLDPGTTLHVFDETVELALGELQEHLGLAVSFPGAQERADALGATLTAQAFEDAEPAFRWDPPLPTRRPLPPPPPPRA